MCNFFNSFLKGKKGLMMSSRVPIKYIIVLGDNSVFFQEVICLENSLVMNYVWDCKINLMDLDYLPNIQQIKWGIDVTKIEKFHDVTVSTSKHRCYHITRFSKDKQNLVKLLNVIHNARNKCFRKFAIWKTKFFLVGVLNPFGIHHN